MRRFLISLLVLSVTFSLQAQERRLKILHTNDLHSRLNGYTPELSYTPLEVDGDPTVGGFSRLYSAIQKEKRAVTVEESLLLDAGDWLMGSLFQSLERSTGFQLNLMHQMGYDLITLGNHEFDWGPDALAEVIIAAKARGPVPPIVFTNIVFDPKSKGDDKLAGLYSDGTIQPYHIIDRNGLRIGFIGIIGYDAISVAPGAAPVTFSDPLKTAKLWADKLRSEYNVDLVICLSHSGVSKEKDGSWGGEDKEMALKIPGIDVIIGGHTHTVLAAPLIFNGTPVVQTGAYGEYLGLLDLMIKEDKSLGAIKGQLLKINDEIPGEHFIQELIDMQERLINETILVSTGLECRSILASAAFDLSIGGGQGLEFSNIGKLLADANYHYMNRSDGPGTNLSFFASGMVRDNMGRGMVSVADAFRIVSLGDGNDQMPGYPLAKVYVTAKELKGIMEVIYLAPSMSADNYVYIGGARVTYDAGKGMLRKIVKIELGDERRGYKELDVSKKNTQLYSITADVYLLEFFGLIKKLSKGLIKVTLKDAQGQPLKSVEDARIDLDPDQLEVQEAKEWMALVWYLKQFPDTDGDNVPDIPESYREVKPAMRGE
jgi:5'-nucleotidase / UDP-sugar diphosphatase